MRFVGSKGILVLALGPFLVLACGSPPPNADFYGPPLASTSGIGGSATAAVTSTTAGVTSSEAATNTTGSTSMGAGGSSGGSPSGVGGTSSGGTGATGCADLPQWDGGNYEFTLSAGDEIQHKGRRYRATQDIPFPNEACAPDAPADWCAGWFEDLGPC